MKALPQIIKPVAFALLCALVLLFVYRTLSWKDTMGPYESSMQQLYATPPGLMDVVFAGTSHCYGGVNPDLMWEENGIAAFNMAVSGQDKASCVHHLREVMKTQRPRVVFVDIYAAAFEYSTHASNIYRNMLAMRTSRNSVSLVNEYIPEGERTDYLLRWPIVHTRYRELGKYDFLSYPPSDFGRGFCIRFGVTPVTPAPDIYLSDLASPLTDSQKKFVDDLHALSAEYGFDLILMLLPLEMNMDMRKAFNAVFGYAETLGIPAMDLNHLREEIGYDYEADFLDADHLNIAGAEKTSRYLASYLDAHYDLPDHRGDAAYELWDKSASYNRHVQLEYDFASTDAVTLVSRILQEEDLVVVCTLQGDYRSSRLPLKQIVKAFGTDDAFYENGGTIIVEDDRIAAYAPPGMTRILTRDADRYTSIRVDDATEADNVCRQIIRAGDTGLVPENGLGILVYDLYTQRVIGARWFYE